MKECPQCRAKYFDNMLEYCLDDGTKLISTAGTIAAPTQSIPVSPKISSTAEKTIEFSQNAGIPLFETDTIQIETQKANKSLYTQKDKIKTSAINQSLTVLEHAPLIVALIHNYWQWLYLSKLYYSGFTTYILSPNFLIWIILLLIGVASSIGALKYAVSKKFAVTALVVLAINVLLYIVPK